jgi:hypothetical protein
MNETIVLGIVTRIYTAAGRRAEEVDMEVWFEALADLNDAEIANVATIAVVRGITNRLPGPGDYRDAYLSIVRRREMEDAPKALAPAPPQAGERERVHALIAEMREQVRNAPVMRRKAS